MITVQQKIDLLNKLKNNLNDHERYILNLIIEEDLSFMLPSKECSVIKFSKVKKL